MLHDRFFLQQTHKQPLLYSHDRLHDPRVTAHAQVVVAAPHRHLPLVLQRAREVVSHGELTGQAVHRLKHAIGVVTLLLLYLLLKKVVVVEAGHCEKRKIRGCLMWLNTCCILMDEATSSVMKVLVHLIQKYIELILAKKNIRYYVGIKRRECSCCKCDHSLSVFGHYSCIQGVAVPSHLFSIIMPCYNIKLKRTVAWQVVLQQVGDHFWTLFQEGPH